MTGSQSLWVEVAERPEIVLAVVVAGAVAAVVRAAVSAQFNTWFPTGTLAINLAASFGLGLASGLDGAWSLVVSVGALGALSTWSTAANEAAVMARDDQGRMAIAYLWLSVSAGVLAAWLGLTLGSMLGWR